MYDSLWPHGLQHARLPCPLLSPRICSISCSLSGWCHPAISSSVIPFSSRLQYFPASGSIPMSQLFASGGQSTGVSSSALVLPMNIQDWFPLGWTGWISLQSKGLLRVFSNTTVQKHQFFGAQLSWGSKSHIHTWLLEIPLTIALTRQTFVGKVMSLLFNMLSRLVIGWFSHQFLWKSQPGSSVQFGECKCMLIWAPEAAPELKGFFLLLFFLLFYNQILLLTVQKSFFLLHTMLLVIQISIELKKIIGV